MQESVYSIWKPSYTKRRSTKHPNQVYESENMASVDLPKINIKLLLKTNSTHSNNFISDVQTEGIAYAINCIDSETSINNYTRGFFLGDGTGVGKSRVISGILSELWIRNNKKYRAIWVSINKNLKNDAKKEFDIVQELQKHKTPWLNEKDLEKECNGVFYTTYGSLLNSKHYNMIFNWLGWDNDNVTIIFDEAHTAKSHSSKKAKIVKTLQSEIYNPRIIYSTATAASSISEMHYMERLGLWKNSHQEFCILLERYGPMAMEMAALQLKHSGKLISRQLGFDGVHIYIKSYKLTEQEEQYFNTLTYKWRNIDNINTFDNFNFYQYLITGFKIKLAIEETRKSINNNESVIIGLQTTGELSCNRDYDSCLQDLFNKYEQHTNSIDVFDYSGNLIEFNRNPIDLIIDEFGSDNVAEISGRKRRRCCITRNWIKIPSIGSEISKFQNGTKNIAIITRSGSSGISLHSQKNINNKTRHHIIIEPPKSADILVQQFGRTHRTNSYAPPKFTFIVTNIPSEIRFFHGLTNKLENLGALTKGDRRVSLLNNLNFEGCSQITNNTFRLFLLEFNVQIALMWYNNNKLPDDFPLDNVIDGLVMNYYNLNTTTKSINTFTKLLTFINHYTINNSYLRDDPETTNSEYIQNLKSQSSNSWNNTWYQLLRLKQIIFYKQSKILISVLLKAIISVIGDYIPYSKQWISHDYTWTIKNHKHHSHYVKDTVNTILLCQLKPECENTIGKIPTHLIHSIIPWIIPKSDFFLLPTNSIHSLNNGIHCSTNINTFLNKMFELQICIQKHIIQMIRSHTVYYSPGKKYSVLDIEEHILGRHKNNFKIIFEDFINSSRFYKIDISVKPKLSLEEHIANRNKWKNRFITYVKHKKHRKKFGILLKALKKHNWSYELWYPGNQKPCRSFMKHQWELEKQNYDNITVNDNIWVENVSNQIIKQEQFAEQFNLTLTFCVNNVIDNWEWSTGKIICVKNTKICPDFIGLLVKIKQRFL
tara:strand:+ start:39983 stop:42964 length:2982 start_codon:yes stop_codon:yes gene_type:complete